MLIILLFTIILNIVSIVLMYYCLGDLSKKEKLIFIAAGTAIMYVLTSFVYWISTKDIPISSVSERGKNLITFLFVPINGILTLPLFARSYFNYKIGRIDQAVLRNRGIVILIILIVILIIECTYFKNIQQQVVDLILEQQKNTGEQGEASTNEIVGNTLEDIETLNQPTNDIVQGNEISQGNVINSVIVNDVTNDVVRDNSVSYENVVEVNSENVIEGNSIN